MQDLESEEETKKRQKGQGLKIMTPKQLITRLPILLAQLKAGNTSKNTSLHSSKNLTKTIYNHLVNSI